MDELILDLDLFLETYYPYMGFERPLYDNDNNVIHYCEDGEFSDINKIQLLIHKSISYSEFKIEVFIKEPNWNNFLYNRYIKKDIIFQTLENLFSENSTFIKKKRDYEIDKILDDRENT